MNSVEEYNKEYVKSLAVVVSICMLDIVLCVYNLSVGHPRWALFFAVVAFITAGMGGLLYLLNSKLKTAAKEVEKLYNEFMLEIKNTDNNIGEEK